MIHKIGEVHDGATTTDWMEQERERGITITAAAITCFWNPSYMPKEDVSKKVRFNVIDTPGHIDFTVEVKRSLRVLDGAVVVFDGVAGVEPQSETNWRYADESNVPRLCFINKMDRMGASFERSYASILERLNKKAVRFQIPIGTEGEHNGVIDLLKMKAYYFDGEKGINVIEKEIPEAYLADAKKYHAELVEKAVEHNDALMQQYLDGKEIPVDTLKTEIRKLVIENKMFPVFTGSALKNVGVQLVLDAVVDYLPAPTDLKAVKGTDTDTDTEEERLPAPAPAPKAVDPKFEERTQMTSQYQAVLGAPSTAIYPEMIRYMTLLQVRDSVAWWSLALTETTTARRPGWQYMKAILEAWLAAGKPTKNGKDEQAAKQKPDKTRNVAMEMLKREGLWQPEPQR
jgi:elongation factor G